MVRVLDLELSLAFFALLGLREVRRREVPSGRFTLVYLATGTPGDAAEVELTWNWDQEDPYTVGRSFGHLAFAVPDIYDLCARLEEAGVPVLRPPRDGRMAFVRSPDGISIELLQDGAALPPREPWASRENQGEW